MRYKDVVKVMAWLIGAVFSVFVAACLCIWYIIEGTPNYISNALETRCPSAAAQDGIEMLLISPTAGAMPMRFYVFSRMYLFEKRTALPWLRWMYRDMPIFPLRYKSIERYTNPEVAYIVCNAPMFTHDGISMNVLELGDKLFEKQSYEMTSMEFFLTACYGIDAYTSLDQIDTNDKANLESLLRKSCIRAGPALNSGKKVE
jgi:hypothetical protein